MDSQSEQDLQKDNRDLVDINEMARILSVSPPGLRKWERQGIVTPYRLPGGERRYDVELTKKQLFNRT